jgi:dCMP deaminase
MKKIAQGKVRSPTRAKSDVARAKAPRRPSFESIYMRLAQALAERSTCRRLQVGTVITSTDYRKVLAVGYNGNASGLSNSCDRDEVGNCGCLHSEENAVINCDSPRSVEKIVFVTHLPCEMCAKRLINLGNVKRIVFGADYRSQKSRELFAQTGIPIEQLQTGTV